MGVFPGNTLLLCRARYPAKILKNAIRKTASLKANSTVRIGFWSIPEEHPLSVVWQKKDVPCRSGWDVIRENVFVSCIL